MKSGLIYARRRTVPKAATRARPTRDSPKSLAALFPRVASEWHPIKNGDLGPGDVGPHTSSKAWWQCPNDATHVWYGTISNHTAVHCCHGTGCITCIEAAELTTASLAACAPAVAAEWHPTKNGPRLPDQVRPNSEVSVWWQCRLDPAHVWRSPPLNRVKRGAGCPFCRRRAPRSPGASLADRRPEIAAQWHPTANAPLTPDRIAPASKERVTWICPADASHIWQSSVAHRTSARGSGCPTCATQKRSQETSLAACNPDVAREWHPTKNGSLGPADVMRASSRKVWWQCCRAPQHQWRTSVGKRTVNGTGCPVCLGHAVTPATSLLGRFPRVAAEWHPTKNARLTPADVRAHSGKIVWWRCHGTPAHEWRARVSHRTRKVEPSGCPACSGRVVTSLTSLAARFPAIANEWHPTKNRYLQPCEVTPRNDRKVWWQCPREPTHEWRAVVYSRTGPSKLGCPLCANKRLSATNSLAARFPAVAAEWHPTKNGRLRPERVIAGASRHVWWQCRQNPAHVWRANLSLRTSMGTGCPVCANKIVTEDNCLTTKRPELAREWHPRKNGKLTATSVVPGSHKKVWWRCQLNPAHEWEAVVYSRSRSGGNGCPHCANEGRRRRSLRGTERAAPDPALRPGRRTRA